MTFEQQSTEVDVSSETLGAQYDHMEARALEVRALYAQLEEERYGEPWSRDKLIRGAHGNAGGIVLNIVSGDRAELAEELADMQWSNFICKRHYFPHPHASKHPLRAAYIDTMQNLPGLHPTNTPLELAGLQAAFFNEFDRFAAGMDGVRPIIDAEKRGLDALCNHQRFLLLTSHALGIPMVANFTKSMDELEIRVRMQLISAQATKETISAAEARIQQQTVLTQGRTMGIAPDVLQAIYEKARIS